TGLVQLKDGDAMQIGEFALRLNTQPGSTGGVVRTGRTHPAANGRHPYRGPFWPRAGTELEHELTVPSAWRCSVRHSLTYGTARLRRIRGQGARRVRSRIGQLRPHFVPQQLC